MFVLTACGPEIVGDDIVAVCEDCARRWTFRSCPSCAPAFAATRTRAPTSPWRPSCEHLVPAERDGAQRSRARSCLIAPHANANPTWMGDLAWVKQVLAQLGATVAATLTHDTALSDLRPDAARPKAAWCSATTPGKRRPTPGRALWHRSNGAAACRCPSASTNTRRWLTELGERLGAEEQARAHHRRGREAGGRGLPAQGAGAVGHAPRAGGHRGRRHRGHPAAALHHRGPGDDPAPGLPALGAGRRAASCWSASSPT